MAKFLALFAGSAILGWARASSVATLMTGSTVSTVEQYCFTKSDGLFSAGTLGPTVTMIFSGMTLTTTPIMLTVTSESLTAALGGPSSSASGGYLATASTTDIIPTSSQDMIASATSSASYSTLLSGVGATGGSGSDGDGLSSRTSTQESLAAGGVPTTPGTGSRGNTPLPQPSVSTGLTDAVSASAGTSPRPTPVDPLLSAVSSSVQDSMLPGVASSGSMRAAPTATDDRIFPEPSTTGIVGFENPSPSLGDVRPSASVGVPRLGDGADNETVGSLNGTLELSSAAADALSLAQFLKNLGVYMFNTSNLGLVKAGQTGNDQTEFFSLVGNISLQEQTQQKAVRLLSHRSGVEDVPSCRYTLPNNLTGVQLAMSAFKAVEGGVLMALAESLPPTDTAAAVVLSSMSSVAARHSAMLRPYVTSNSSVASFDTPMTDVWAYNLGLTYVQPGSCAVEQRIPLLPGLSLDNGIAATARPSSRVTFAWDTAARAAASRSGKPLFIGWVNQVNAPVYTALAPLGDGRGSTEVPAGLVGTAFAVLTAQPGLTTIGDLTEATLAGPVVVSLL